MSRESEEHVLHQMYVAAERFDRMKSALRVGGAALSLAAILSLGTRSYDYLRDPPLTNEQFAFVELFGIREWGYAFGACAIAIAIGMLAFYVYPKKPWFLLGGHVLAIIVYCGYFVAIAQGVVMVGSGWRSLTVIIAATISSSVRIGMLNGERDI